MANRLDMRIFGRVQGVAYRWHARARALELGLEGWVRNQPDGSVRAVAEGPRDRLESFRDWAARGPDRARVERVEETWLEATGTLGDFTITG